jgi:hypothetical protein
MAAEAFSSLGGYSVGIPAVTVIDEDGVVIGNVNTAGSVRAATIYTNSVQYPNGTPFITPAAGSNTQLQFNSNGGFGASGNLTFNTTTNTLSVANISLTGPANLRLGGGVDGYVLQTDGEGNLTWTAQTGGGGGNGSPGGANTQIQFNDAGSFGGDAGFTYNKNTNTLNVENISAGNSIDDTINAAGSFTASGNITATNILATANVTGEYIFGNAFYMTGLITDVANYVAQPDQSNITSLGNLTFINVDGDYTGLGDVRTSGDMSAGNISLSGNVSAGNAAFTTKVTIGSNLTINSAGVLRVAGNLNSAGSPNISLGTLSNIHITGGTGGQVLATDGTGNLYWTTGGGGGGNGSPGGTNMSVQFNSGGDFAGVNAFTFDAGSNILSVPSIRSNSSVNFTGAANVTLGNVANLHITGGQNGYVLQTDGSGHLSWAAGGGGGNGVPGGANTQVQFNNDGTFGGSAFLTYNDYTHVFQVGGNLIANSTQIGAGVYKFSTSRVYFATTASSSPRQVLFSIPVSEISGVEYQIIATEPAGPSRQSVRISAITYDGTVQFTEYAGLYINGGVGNFEVDYNPGDIVTPASIELLITPNTSNAVTYKMLITEFAG